MLLRLGSKGSDVIKLQEKLKVYFNGIKSVLVDGDFGPDTKAFVELYQERNKLDVDGVAGPRTLASLGLNLEYTGPNIITPNGYYEIIKAFGEPWIDGWKEAYLTKVIVPENLKHVAGWERGYFWGNRLCKPHFELVLKEIALDPELFNHLKVYDGCFNVRKKRTSDQWSTHSWAIAYDLNASDNPLGHEPVMHPKIVEIHEKHGFVWGGKWRCKDGQHFQLAKGY